LEGRSFLSVSVVRDGAAISLVPGTQVRLGFRDGQINASAGCNSISGRYQLNGNVLLVDQLGMTEMACDPPARMDQDTWLADLLSHQPTLALDGNTLTVTAGGTVIDLLDREVADPDQPLVGPLWVVDSIISGDAVSSIQQGATATMQFDANGGITLDTGCNSGGGHYVVDGSTLRFSDIITTKRACAGAGGALEGAVLSVLRADGVEYHIEAQGLSLLAGGQGLHLSAANAGV